MIKNNNFLDSLSKTLLADVRGVMEGKKKACKCDNNCACGKEEKGENKADDEKAEMKNEAYNEKAVDTAIKSSRQKIGGREAKKIHALLKGSSGYAAKKAATDCKEEAELEEGEEKGGGYNAPKARGAMVYKKVLGQHTVHKGNSFHRSFPTEGDAIKYIQKNEGKKDVKEGLDEAKAESPIKGTRLISKHQGKDGHHAEVRHNSEYNEYQVHHYENGKHMGEGPVSYHDTKDDAKEAAEYEVKHYRPKNGSLHKEEVEQVDEASKDKMLKYLAANKKSDKAAQEKGDYSKTDKRMRGADMAVRKYTATNTKYVRVPATEEVQIDEEVDFAKVRKQFDRNEDRNEHSKNAVLIAKHCGNEGDHNEAKDIMNKHNELGHLSGPLSARRSALYAKLKKTDNYKKIFPEENVKEEAEIDEAKKMKGEDPCWKDYKMVGTKKKGGKEVPNCVPEETEVNEKLIGNQKKIDKNKNGKLDKQDFKLLRKEETIEEKLNPSMGAAAYIKDFVDSKDPRFEGKTKKERMKQALAAYYAAKGEKNESVETEEVDAIEEGYGDKRDYHKIHINVNGKYVATTTWARNAKEAEKRFIDQHPEHKNAKITVVKER